MAKKKLAKRAISKKTSVVKKAAVKKTSPAPKKASGKTAAKKTGPKKAPAKKTTSKSSVSKKTPAKKAAVKKAVSKKSVSKKPVPKKAVAKKAVARKTTGKAVAAKKRVVTKKAAAPVRKSASTSSKGKKLPIITPKKKYEGENILTIYLVVKVAIYNHDIFGAYRNKEEAIEVANDLAFSEVGGNHTYDVVEIPLNSLKQISYNDHYGQSCEQKTVFTSSKKLATPENESMLFGWEI